MIRNTEVSKALSGGKKPTRCEELASCAQGTETIGKYIPSMSINNPVTPCHNSVWQAHEQNMCTNQLVKQSCFAGMRI